MSGPGPTRPPLARRALAELTGTGLLVSVVVGSGITAVRLSPGAVGLELLENSLATAVLVLVVFSLARSGRSALAPAAVAGWVGAAYWATSSTSFANPAVTIAPASVPGFVAAQAIGAALGAALVLVFYPVSGQAAGGGEDPAGRETAAAGAVPVAGS